MPKAHVYHDRHVPLSDEAKAIKYQRARKTGNGKLLWCNHHNKLMYNTWEDVNWVASNLQAIGYLFMPHKCKHPKSSHYHLTTMGFTRRAHRRAQLRRQVNDQPCQ